MVYGGKKGLLKLGGILWLGMGGFLLLGAWATGGLNGLTRVWGTVVFAAGIGGWSFWQARRWQGINARRQAVARGESKLASVAPEQSISDATALPLPHTIRLRPRMLQNVLLGAAFVGLLLLAQWVYSLLTRDESQWLAVLIVAGVVVAFGLLAGLIGHPRITVTTYGLEVRGHVQGGQVPWKQARLFAIREGGKPGTPATHYELASESGAVEWKRLRRLRWYSLQQPDLPFDVYDPQMEALLALIAAKTGLALADLR